MFDIKHGDAEFGICSSSLCSCFIIQVFLQYGFFFGNGNVNVVPLYDVLCHLPIFFSFYRGLQLGDCHESHKRFSV